jgi:hypothetical protein
MAFGYPGFWSTAIYQSVFAAVSRAAALVRLFLPKLYTRSTSRIAIAAGSTFWTFLMKPSTISSYMSFVQSPIILKISILAVSSV